MSLKWVQCPECKESHDITRLGKPLILKVSREGKIQVTGERRVKCGYCGSTWETDEPTFREAMGYDGECNTPF